MAPNRGDGGFQTKESDKDEVQMLMKFEVRERWELKKAGTFKDELRK